MRNWLNPGPGGISGSINSEMKDSAVEEIKEASEKGYITINGKRYSIKK